MGGLNSQLEISTLNHSLVFSAVLLLTLAISLGVEFFWLLKKRKPMPSVERKLLLNPIWEIIPAALFASMTWICISSWKQ